MESEIEFHRDMRQREYEAAGMTPDEARRAVERRLGDTARARAEGIAIRFSSRPVRASALERLRHFPAATAQILVQALRSLRAAPTFSLAAMLTLAIGIGANAAAFSVTTTVLVRPLPYFEPADLIYVPRADRDTLEAFRKARTLATAAGHGLRGTDMIGPDGPSRVLVVPVSEGFFELFGVAPIAGRVLGDGDHLPGVEGAVVITEHLAQRTFGNVDGSLGGTLQLGGRVYSVVGVMPAGVELTRYAADAWVPAIEDGQFGVRFVAARMNESATIQQARTELQTIAEQVHAAQNGGEPDGNRREFRPYSVVTMHESIVGMAGNELLLITAVSGLLLMVACANVANLLLARGGERRVEFAVRAALGAGRARLMTQVLAESTLLALGGALLGACVVPWVTGALLEGRPHPLPKTGQVAFDSWVWIFLVVVAVTIGWLAAVPTALAMPGRSLTRSLHDRGAASAPRSQRLRQFLVIGEVAVAVVLLAGAGLLLRTFLNIRPSAPGFEWRDKLALRLELPASRYPDAASWSRFLAEARAELARVPGVETAEAIDSLPMTGLVDTIEPVPEAAQEDSWPRWMVYRQVSPGYLEAMEIQLRRGRSIAVTDIPGSPAVAVVNELAALRMWPGQDPVGKSLRALHGDDELELRVVGVVSNVWFMGSPDPRPEVYVPIAQQPTSQFEMVVQGRDPGGLLRPVAEAIGALDPLLPIGAPGRRDGGAVPLASVLAAAVRYQRYTLTVVAAFATIALTLTAVGIYGVLANAVSRRTREIGIRVALGAHRERVLRLIIGQGLRLVAVGLGIGSAVALWATRWLESFLYGVSPSDPWTYAGLCVFVFAVAMIACWLPARRATRIDPARALADS